MPETTVFGALSVMLSVGLYTEAHQHGEMNVISDASVQQIIREAGVVKGVDLSSEKVVISRETIPTIDWPAVTIHFTFVSADSSITALKAGTRVSFAFVQRGNVSLLKSIDDTQS